MICAICQEDFELPYFDLESGEEGDLVEGKIRLACRHIFHFPCLKQWSEREKICPLDRSPLGEKVIVRLTKKTSTLDKILSILSEMMSMRVWGEMALMGLEG